MPKQIDTQLETTYKDTIFYKRNGEYYSRSKGRTGTQAPIAKQQASLLGQASALSARLRKAFKPLLPVPASRTLMYRLNNVLQQWMRNGQPAQTGEVNDIQLLKGFSFSDGKTADDFYAVMPISRLSNGNIALHIPSFDSPNPIHPLPFTGQISLHIMAVSCNLADSNETQVFETNIEIAYTGYVPANDLEIPVQTKPGHILVVALSVNKLTTGIVGAMYN